MDIGDEHMGATGSTGPLIPSDAVGLTGVGVVTVPASLPALAAGATGPSEAFHVGVEGVVFFLALWWLLARGAAIAWRAILSLMARVRLGS